MPWIMSIQVSHPSMCVNCIADHPPSIDIDPPAPLAADVSEIAEPSGVRSFLRKGFGPDPDTY